MIPKGTHKPSPNCRLDFGQRRPRVRRLLVLLPVARFVDGAAALQQCLGGLQLPLRVVLPAYVPALPLGVWDVRLQHDVTGAAGSRSVACRTCYAAGAPPSNDFVLRPRASNTVPLSIYRSYLWSI